MPSHARGMRVRSAQDASATDSTPRVEGESRRGSAVVADGRRRQSRASQAGAVVVHEPFVPPAWPVFLLGSPVVERPCLARGARVAELGEGPYVAAALRLAQAACDALGPFPCDVLGITQAPFPQVLGQAGEALPVLAHRPLGPRLLREVGHDLLCVAHVPVVHGRLSSLRGFPHCGRMTVRMLRAGAGTWPVARPKRADKIMRRIRPFLRTFGERAENAVGFLRRNLLVPVPSVASVDELNARLRVGCERINSTSRNKFREPTTRTFPADFAAMMSLPGVRFDSVRWLGARSDKRGYVRVDGNSYCAGPAWHDRDLVVGVRANSVDILADRNRRVATLPRCWGEGELVRNPLSLVPAIVARPRAFGESTIRRDMPEDLVAAIDRCDRPQVRRALRAIERAAATSGFGAACEAARRIFGGGRVPDDASCDMLARRVAAGERDGGGVDLTAYDRLVGEGARLRAV